MLLLLAMPAAMRAQSTTVTIGDPSSNIQTYALPFEQSSYYSLAQQIYTADEINMPDGGTITSISFEYTYTQPFSLDGIQVYMKNVNKNNFENTNDMVEVNTSNKVFEGIFSAPGAGWVTLTLNTPFHYDGTSNLLVCFLDTINGRLGSSYTFRATIGQSNPNPTIVWYHGSIIPDINNLGSFSGIKETLSYRANIQIGITPSAVGSGSIDFETGDFSQYSFVNDATYPWIIVDA